MEPLVRYPLQTRATVARSSINDNTNWISRLANYFDTSNIEIPMAQVPPKPKRNYRRKQKLETIDLNNNPEIVLQDIRPEVPTIKRERKSSSSFSATKNVEKEVEEIFKQRKKKRSIQNTLKESDSDSDEIPLKLIKTHKCPNCKKMYKTPKTLGQHLKKCSPQIVSSTTGITEATELPIPMEFKEEFEGKVKVFYYFTF